MAGLELAMERANKGSTEKSDRIFNKSLGNLQTEVVDGLLGLNLSKEKLNKVMTLVQCATINAYKMGLSTGGHFELTEEAFTSLLYDRDFKKAGQQINEDMKTLQHLFCQSK